MQFIDLQKQQSLIKDPLKAAINKVLEHGQYVLGPEVFLLEEQLSEFIDVKHTISAASGTDALIMALLALDIQPGDEVITTPFSFFASAEAIALLNAKVVFVDIDEKTYNLDPDLLEAAITSKTKAIMPVSLYGQCAELNKICEIAQRHKLPVIEDAAQSFGARHYDKKSCSIATIACTSFFPSKPLGAYGDAGACFTNDLYLAERIRQVRNHGQVSRYNHDKIGINGRMDTIQAAILLEKLKIFPLELEQRNVVAENYNSLLGDFCNIPHIEKYNFSAFAQYTVKVPERELIQKALNENNIPTAVHYPKAIHKQKVFKDIYRDFSYPVAEKMSREVMSLPMHPYLEFSDQEIIARSLQEALLQETV